MKKDSTELAYISSLLSNLNFKQTEGVWTKKYKSAVIKVDTGKGKITYPEEIILGDKTTSNFTRDENFVVLECVDRLLEKGYLPNRIELEKTWTLGRAKKGKLDILVREKDNENVFLMIECKTYGQEFEKETNKMLDDSGGQLFSYWQQDRSAAFLCLYTSIFNQDEQKVDYHNRIVSIDGQIRDSGSVQEAYTHWNKQFLYKGLFESEVNPYKTEFKPLTRKDLKPLGKPDGNRIYHQFLEILRHNIVSDKGNAFNKIFNLFLCKILDEDRNESEELHFQWKEGIDDEESLLGRLNGLYKIGMLEYLNKDVTDYSEDDVAEIKDSQVRRIINELRLYKNQEFAFVDVFNRESFLENSKIVIELVKLLQGWQIRYSHKQQFLGEFFELLLSTGFKQESGQFFTPVPLVRFILQSIPIREVIQSKIENGDQDFLPYLIDFACGSGHFLTEAMDIIFVLIHEIDKGDLSPSQKQKLGGYLVDQFGWAKDYIYGIERDYRLAKTSKLASFLNGDGEAVIVHASGIDPLSSESYRGKLNESAQAGCFDILVANPPYAVKGFKRTVLGGDNSFSLYKELSDKSGDIEVLFIERMTQLVKPEGYVGIILPLSILNNTGIYEKARRHIFENFQLKALVVLSSKAFMATGINTVVFFLKKRKEPVTLKSIDSYRNLFENDSGIEGGVIVAISPEKEFEKKFLGYEFSSRKGSEGLKSHTDSFLLNESNQSSEKHLNSYILQIMMGKSVSAIDNRLKPYVKNVLLSDLIDWDYKPFSNAIYVKGYVLKYKGPGEIVIMNDCIDPLESGSRPKGGASELASGIGSLGGTQINGDKGVVILEKIKRVPSDFYQKMKTGHVKDKDILVCKDGALTGKCSLFIDLSEPYCVNEHVFIVRAKSSKCSQKFMFYFMMSSFFQNQVRVLAYTKKGQPGLNKGHFKQIKFPLFPQDEQLRIVHKIDSAWDDLVENGERKRFIDKVFQKAGLSGYER